MFQPFSRTLKIEKTSPQLNRNYLIRSLSSLIPGWLAQSIDPAVEQELHGSYVPTIDCSIQLKLCRDQPRQLGDVLTIEDHVRAGGTVQLRQRTRAAQRERGTILAQRSLLI